MVSTARLRSSILPDDVSQDIVLILNTHLLLIAAAWQDIRQCSIISLLSNERFLGESHRNCPLASRLISDRVGRALVKLVMVSEMLNICSFAHLHRSVSHLTRMCVCNCGEALAVHAEKIVLTLFIESLGWAWFRLSCFDTVDVTHAVIIRQTITVLVKCETHR